MCLWIYTNFILGLGAGFLYTDFSLAALLYYSVMLFAVCLIKVRDQQHNFNDDDGLIKVLHPPLNLPVSILLNVTDC